MATNQAPSLHGYLDVLLSAVDTYRRDHGGRVPTVEVRDAGLDDEDLALLR